MDNRFITFTLMFSTVVFPVYLVLKFGISEFLLVEIPILGFWLSQIFVAFNDKEK